MGKLDATAEAVLVLPFHQRADGEIVLPLCISDAWNPPKWRINGGGVKNGETLLDAAERECREENGLTIAELLLFRSIQKRSRSPDHPTHTQHVFVGVVLTLDGFLPETVDGSERLKTQLFTLKVIRESLWTNRRLGQYAILAPHGRIIEDVVLTVFE